MFKIYRVCGGLPFYFNDNKCKKLCKVDQKYGF